MMPRLDSPAWMAIYQILAAEVAGGQDEVARVTEEIYRALLRADALKKRAA